MDKVKKQKIVITDEMLEEIGEFMSIADILDQTSIKIRTKVETILSMVAVYDVEIPNKKVKKLIDSTKRSVKWVDKN
jgi:hypothetical protein|tara:strand:+ start:54 stop:284 length:231 start_codon:yes stop_codon:yes gene_type:complete